MAEGTSSCRIAFPGAAFVLSCCCESCICDACQSVFMALDWADSSAALHAGHSSRSLYGLVHTLIFRKNRSDEEQG